MSWWIYMTPFIAAVTGWCVISLASRFLFRPVHPVKIAGISFQGVIPKRQKLLAAVIGRQSAALFSVKEIEEKITHPGNVKKIMPQAETHIDHFLRVKLVKSMPMVGMFVGDKTINNLKSLFVTELEELFPEIMKNYMERLQEDFNVEEIVTNKMIDIDPAVMESAFLKIMKKELRFIKLLGAFLCFSIAWLQLILVLLLK